MSTTKNATKPATTTKPAAKPKAPAKPKAAAKPKAPAKPKAAAAASAPACPPTTQPQAVQYMNNEIAWAQIIVLAWQDAAVYALLQKNADNANKVVTELATRLGIQTEIPEGVTLKVAFDSPTEVHLLMPSVTYIPCGPLDMVPHSL